MARVHLQNGLGVFFLALLLVLPFQGTRPFMGRDENRYPEVAYEMLQSGDYLVPHFKGRIHLTKPPLTYWAIAASYKLLGVSPWGARLPNALAFAFTTLFVFLMGKELFGKDAGYLAALLYMGTLVPFAAANIVTTDTLLVMWESAALWTFLRGIKEGRKRWFLLMWLFWALAFLTKGTAILPVAAGAFLFWFINRKRFFSPFYGPGILLFLALGLSWYLYIWIHIPGALNTFWVEQIYGRIFSDVFHRNSKWYAPFYLYLPLLTLGAFPVSWLWVKNISRFSWQAFKKAFCQKWEISYLTYQFGVPLVVFCLAKSRLPLYILPLYIPLALSGAQIWLTHPSQRFEKFLWFWFIFLLILKMFSVFYCQKLSF